MKITVLRLCHRKERDKRVTTHCALVARAFGAKKIILSGEKDDAVVKSVEGVVKNWGGDFEITYEANWKKALRSFKGTKVHLTMYGKKVNDFPAIKKSKNLLVVIGASKVPAEVYKMVDANVAIGSQPHSEVAALAVFLLETLGERQLWAEKKKARVKIIPQKNSKRVVTNL